MSYAKMMRVVLANYVSPYEDEINLYLRLLSSYNSLAAQECSVAYFRRLLVRNHIPPPAIADDLIGNLIRCLNLNYNNIRRDAAWALTNCACSPHEICYKIIENNGLESLAHCAYTSDGETRDQVFWTVGNIALDCPTCQNEVRQSSLLPVMIGILISPSFGASKWKRNLIWALSQVFRGGIRSISFMYLRAALKGLCAVLYADDSRLRVDATWAIAYVADDMAGGQQIDLVLETPNLLDRLISLLDDVDARRAALRAVGNLAAGGDEQTQRVLDAGVVPKLLQMLDSNLPNLKREILWILSNIAAGSADQIGLLFTNTKIVRMLTDAFYNGDPKIQKEAGWTISNALTGASNDCIRWLCSSNILRVMPDLLAKQTETNLMERTIYALELLVTRRRQYFILLKQYQIISALDSLARCVNSDLIKIRATTLLQWENEWDSERTPERTYSLIR